MKWFALVLVLLVSPLALAKSSAEEVAKCNERMQKKAARQKADDQIVADALQTIRSLGLKELLWDFDNGDVEVQIKKPWLPMMQDPVSARISFLNQKILLVRRIDVSTPERKQLFIWRVALALYELQMEPALWSQEAIFPEDLPPGEDANSYWSRIPRAWADERMELCKRLMNELYTLFMNLPDVSPNTIMPPTDITGELYAAVHKKLGISEETAMPDKDPGLYWKVKALVLRDASQDIGPNLADYRRWLVSGKVPVTQALDQRHAKSTLFNYYMNHVKRMLMITSLMSTLAWAPHLLEIPSYIETHNIDVERSHQLDTAELRNDDIERKAHEIYVENQIQEINRSITAQEKLPNPDKAYIATLKSTLQALVDQNPGSIYMTLNRPNVSMVP